MRWLIVFFLSSCSLMTRLSTVLTPIEQTSSYGWVQLLHLDDCEFPCWIHIEPGTTTLSEAQTQVQNEYADTSLYDVTGGEDYYKVVYRPNGYQVRIWFRSDNGNTVDKSLIRVLYLELAVETGTEIKRPTIADLEVFLGEPEMVRLSSGVETPTYNPYVSK